MATKDLQYLVLLFVPAPCLVAGILLGLTINPPCLVHQLESADIDVVPAWHGVDGETIKDFRVDTNHCNVCNEVCDKLGLGYMHNRRAHELSK